MTTTSGIESEIGKQPDRHGTFHSSVSKLMKNTSDIKILALLHEEWVNFKAERWFEPLFKGIC